MNKIVAIHQPDFFPWLGFFNKLKKADIFLVMDNVQFEKTGGSWTNRVRICIENKQHWLTIPVVRSYHGFRLIREMEINNRVDWRRIMIDTIKYNYSRTPYFKELFPYIRNLISFQTDSLYEYNLNIIKSVATGLKLDLAKICIGSEMDVKGRATDLLISMTKAAGGTGYMYGGGAIEYQQDDEFKKAHLKLIFQQFMHPVYPQKNSESFISGLSILDPLMNCGFDGTIKLIS